MSSEFARIGLMEAILKRPSGNIALGIGDDCAVLSPSALARVWTVDAAVEGVHFSRALMELEQIGYRAFMAAASDVAAMGGRCVAALSALTLPASFQDDELAALTRGLARASDQCACPVVGGNLARADALTLTTTVIGECPERVLSRRGAQPGDGIYVTGSTGGAALGLAALTRGAGHDPALAPFVAKFLAPRARLDVALDVARLASASIDISDGLAQDLSHLCKASGVGATLELARLPELGELARAAAHVDADSVALALAGGEDYELLFTSGAPVPSALGVRIGVIERDPELFCARDERGAELPWPAGFDHFASER